MNRRSALAAIAALGPALAPAGLRAQGGWRPSRPVAFVVGFAPGGSTDTAGRITADAISGPLGQPVVVENRVGGAGNIASEHVARAAPDGHTFVVASVGTHATNQFLYRSMPFHVVDDFTPVSLVIESAAVLVLRPGLPIASVPALIEHAKRNPGALNMGTAGAGSTQHFAGALFQERAGVRFTDIPYRGGAPAMADLIAGRVDLLFAPIAESIGFIRSGQVRPLGVTRTRPLPAMPELRPIAEDLPGYEFNSWIGIFGPARLPEPIIQAVSGAIAEAVRSPRTRQRLEEQGYIPAGGSAAEMAAAQRRDVRLMEELVRLTGATGQ